MGTVGWSAAVGMGFDGVALDGLGAVGAFRDAIDGLAGLDLARLVSGELLDVVRELEVQKRRLAGVDQALLAQLGLRHVAGEKGCRDTAALLVDQLRINPVEARMRVGDAADFGPSATLTGQPLPPVFPELAAAIGAGEISVGHARAVTKFVDAVPKGLPEGVVETARAHLLKAAGQTYPAQVAKLATGLLARLDQDGPEPHEEAEQRRRGFTLFTGPDGWSKSDGYLSPLLTASFNALFDSLGGPKPAEDGTADDRSPAARRHDALLDAAQRLLRSGTLPDAGGAPITVLVTIDEADLRERVAHTTGPSAAPDSGSAGRGGRGGVERDMDPGDAANGSGASRTAGYGVTSHGDLLPIADILALAAEATFIPVVLNDAGGVVSYGRSQRLATAAMRRALAARDQGCSFPGCDIPPEWCEAHHTIPWEQGGNTSLEELAFLCGPHHRDHTRQGWQCQMIDGVPHWIPPRWIDPERKPRRNTAHHRPPPILRPTQT